MTIEREREISTSTRIALLVCSAFDEHERSSVPEPLDAREFTDFLTMVERIGMPLESLFGNEYMVASEADLMRRGIVSERIARLLDRKASLDGHLSRWERQGIRVLDRSTPSYPTRFLSKLHGGAPPLLFACGDLRLIHDRREKLAVVGSRDLDPQTSKFARRVGALAAQSEMTVVSGGARGADSISVASALEHDGAAINILPGDLQRVVVLPRFSSAINAGRLLLLSPYHPGAEFSAGNALGRNRLIYALADRAVVVDAREGAGGTWSGATDAMERRLTPVLVRYGDEPSPGNRSLLNRGALPLMEEALEDVGSFKTSMSTPTQSVQAPEPQPTTRQLGLFDK